MFRRLIDDTRCHIPVIFVLSLLLYFPLLGARDFWGHENEYAEVTRVMLRERDFWLLQANGTLWTRHPALFFWLAALFSWPTGQVSEWSMRLVPAVSATVLMLFSYRFLARRFDARLAFLSIFVLATSLLTIHVERHLPINMVFFLFVMLSMLLLLEVIVFDSTRLTHSYGVWTFMGLACLTKGPVGTFLPVFVTVLYLFRAFKVVSRLWLRGIREFKPPARLSLCSKLTRRGNSVDRAIVRIRTSNQDDIFEIPNLILRAFLAPGKPFTS